MTTTTDGKAFSLTPCTSLGAVGDAPVQCDWSKLEFTLRSYYLSQNLIAYVEVVNVFSFDVVNEIERNNLPLFAQKSYCTLLLCPLQYQTKISSRYMYERIVYVF